MSSEACGVYYKDMQAERISCTITNHIEEFSYPTACRMMKTILMDQTVIIILHRPVSVTNITKTILPVYSVLVLYFC